MSELKPIRDVHTIVIEGWTWREFLAYVTYESQFVGPLKRINQVTYTGRTTVHGYAGFPIERTTVISLMDPDGEVPPWEDEVTGDDN